MNKIFKYNEKGITLFSVIITIILMIILSGITIKSLQKKDILNVPNIVTEYSDNIISDTDEGVNTINNGIWTNVINQKGIEKPIGENGIRE